MKENIINKNENNNEEEKTIISKNVFYMHRLNVCGGVESFFYYMARKFKDRDITIVYKTGHASQVNRLKKYVRTIMWNGHKIKCDRIFFNYNYDIINSVEAKEYAQVIHTDYMNQDVAFIPHPKITRYIGVSEIVCENFKKKFGIECELIYNPLDIPKPRKILHLISATRLTKEKGKDRIEKLGKLLNQAGIPYIWEVFTDNAKEIDNPNIAWMKPRTDISDYIADADYLVQLSNQGEGRGYSVEEALTLGTPVIVTPVKAFLDMVEDGKNGFVVPFSLKDVDCEKIYNSRFKFKYDPPYTLWNDILDGKSTYNPDKANKNYEVIRVYDDVNLGRTMKKHESIECDEERAKFLKKKGVIQ